MEKGTEEIEISRKKTGIVKCANCCASCKHYTQHKCKLYDLATGPGLVCDSFNGHKKRIDRKEKEVEYQNKIKTVDAVFDRYPDVTLLDIEKYLPKATCDKAEEGFFMNHISDFTTPIKQGMYNEPAITICGNQYPLYKFVTYDVYLKMHKAYIEYLYQLALCEINRNNGI